VSSTKSVPSRFGFEAKIRQQVGVPAAGRLTPYGLLQVEGLPDCSGMFFMP
jgi:hypothetical protein